jgi:hypothetical protein
MNDVLFAKGGQIEAGEMALINEKANRLLPTAIFARWSSKG